MIFRKKPSLSQPKPGKGHFEGPSRTTESIENHPDVSPSGAKLSSKRRNPKLNFKVS